MMTKAELVALLKAQLSAGVLQLRSKNAAFDVVPWYQEANMLKDYLQNGKVDVLFSVREEQSRASRFLTVNRVPKADVVSYEVAVWLIDSPSYTKSEKDTLRDTAVSEVKRILKAYPTYGRQEAGRVNDHYKGNVWILNSLITITKLLED